MIDYANPWDILAKNNLPSAPYETISEIYK